MKINIRSLRVRAFILYIFFSFTTMICLGGFSYWYLDRALASSSQHTMEAREERLIHFVDEWPQNNDKVTLVQKLHQLSLAIASTDMVHL